MEPIPATEQDRVASAVRASEQIVAQEQWTITPTCDEALLSISGFYRSLGKSDLLANFTRQVQVLCENVCPL